MSIEKKENIILFENKTYNIANMSVKELKCLVQKMEEKEKELIKDIEENID